MVRESLKSVCASIEKHTEQLMELINSTKSATHDIQRSLVEASVISTKVEQLVNSGQLSTKEQLTILTHINKTTINSNKLTHHILSSTKSQVTNLNKVTRAVEENSAHTTLARRSVERWLKAIAQYCKGIISMVERNTRILLELRILLENVESKIMHVGIDLPILVFQDPFGERMALPWQLCQTWTVSLSFITLFSKFLTNIKRDSQPW